MTPGKKRRALTSGFAFGLLFWVGSVIADELPDAPMPQTQKKPWYQVTVNLSAQSAIQKTGVLDIVTLDYSILGSDDAVGNPQMVQDFGTADKLYGVITGTSPGSPQTLAQLYTFLNSNKNITLNAKELLLGTLGNTLGGLYIHNDGFSVTSLSAVFSALKNNTDTAGVCRDIHTFIATAATALGLEDAGTMGTDWNNGMPTAGHVVAYFKDPTSGKFVFINYGDISETSSNYLSEAALQQSLNMATLSSVTVVESGTGTSNTVEHEMQNARTKAVFGLIHSSSNPDQPKLILSVGTLQNTVSFRDKIAGGPNNNLTGFAVAAEDREELPFQMAAAGIRENSAHTSKISNQVSVDVTSETEAGMIGAHDQTPSGNAWNSAYRKQIGGFVNTQEEADIDVKTGNNDAKIGVRAKGQDFFYPGAGNPFTIVSIVASDNPTKNIQIHGSMNAFLWGSTMQDESPRLQTMDDVAGVTISKQLDHGKVSVSNDLNVHALGGVGSGAVGVHDDSKLTYHSDKKGDFSVSTDVGYVHNDSGDVYYNYPVTCNVKASWDKKVGKVSIDANAQYDCNDHNDFNEMQDDSPSSEPGATTTQPKEKVGITVTW
jgi:hypothetical protein